MSDQPGDGFVRPLPPPNRSLMGPRHHGDISAHEFAKGEEKARNADYRAGFRDGRAAPEDREGVLPLTAEEEQQWRWWLADGHMPYGTDEMQGGRIARLLATLDRERLLTPDQSRVEGLDVEALMLALQAVPLAVMGASQTYVREAAEAIAREYAALAPDRSRVEPAALTDTAETGREAERG